MVGLAIDIVAFCIVAAAVVGVAMLMIAAWIAFGGWLHAVPGRRKRFWTGTALLVGGPLACGWYETSRATFVATVAWGALIGVAVGILRIKDRWPAVGVALAWLTWWGLLLGLVIEVLRAEGRLP